MSKQIRRYIFTVAIIFGLSAVLLATGLAAAQGAGSSGHAYAIVNGGKASIATGQIIASGKLLPDGRCEMPDLKLVGEGSNNSPPHGSIAVRVTHDCKLVVTDITFDHDATPPEKSSTGTDVAIANPVEVSLDKAGSVPTDGVGTLTIMHYRGWAESEYNDIVGIDLTKVYASMKYYDNGSSVYGGHEPVNYCSWTADGWRCVSCSMAWSPTGPSYVWTNTQGTFEWIGGLWPHWHLAQYVGSPGSYSWGCMHTGSTVPGGYWKCEGGRQTL